jgi:UDP-3-O-[3-hydroxymyristoyl] glucosamine N-acyltransferase
MTNMRTFHYEDIRDQLPANAIVTGRTEDVAIATARSSSDSESDSIVWLNRENTENVDILQTVKANVVIADRHAYTEINRAGVLFIWVENPRLIFLRVVTKLFEKKPQPAIHPSATIHKEAQIATDTFIGAGVSIGEAIIGNSCVIHPNVVIYHGVQIGNNVIIHAGSVIGADGFGYQKNENGELEKFPHIGGVEIADNVEIGSNVCVDRGTLGNTVIMEGAKIDNFVHIAHNVVVGRHAAVIAHAMIGGSTIIGDHSWIAPSAALRDRLKIGSHVTVGLGAIVTKNIPDGETWIGNPAREISQVLKKKE